MEFNFPAYSIVFFAGFLVSIAVMIIILKRRPAPGALPFALFVFSGAVWSLALILEIGATEIASKILWAKVEYLGIISTGVLWLTFTLDYSGYRKWKSPRYFIPLGLVPLSTLIVVWTNEWHGWFWSDVYLASRSLGTVIVWEHGFWFTLFSVFQYSLILIGIIILWRFGLRKSRVYRQQIILLTFGILVPIISNIGYISGSPLTEGLDFTPLALAASALIFALTIYGYRFLDLVPLARSASLENIPDGIIVVNDGGDIAEINPAAARMAGLNKTSVMGKSLEKIWGELYRASSEADFGMHTELKLGTNGSILYLDMNTMALQKKRGAIGGKLIVLRDVTERRKMEEFLKQSYDRLQRALQSSIYAAAKMVEIKDPYTAGHQQKVAQLATAIAQDINLPEEQVTYIGMAAMVHDIGKIYIPAEILTRMGTLSDLEFKLIKTHVQRSYEILKDIEFPWPVAEIVLQHHERLDGSGYPKGLKGNDILLEARIIGVADTIEAISTHRPYRSAPGAGEALEEITSNRGTLYDIDVVNSCISLFYEKGFRFESPGD
jgi:PAS domain S-box-containing protein/putative nucleotidyltransferase with HDIG domain